MKRNNSNFNICCSLLLMCAGLASSNAEATVSTYVTAGTTCTGSSVAATYTPGGSAVKVSVCATTSSEYICGFTTNFQAASPALSGKFFIGAITVGSDFGSVFNFPGTSPFPIIKPANNSNYAETAASYGLAPASDRLLATFDFLPQATATASSYVVSLSTISMISLGTGTGACYYAAPSDTAISGSITLNKL